MNSDDSNVCVWWLVPQAQLQYGTFMIVCVRCNQKDFTPHSARQRAVKQALQHPDFSKQVGRTPLDQ